MKTLRVEAKALPTNDARVVVKFLKSLFSRFGAPRAIISDRGTHFCNDKFDKVMSKYGVTHRLSTAYHPQTSGQVEVTNRGLKRILERTRLPFGCTPYKIIYGKSCHLPVELEHKAYWALKHANFDLKTAGDHRKLQLNELNELRDQAYENSLIYKEKTKKLHDSKIKNRIFNVGDQPNCLIPMVQISKSTAYVFKHYYGGDTPPLVIPDSQTFPNEQQNSWIESSLINPTISEDSRVRFAKVYKAFSSEVHAFRLVFSRWGVKSLSTYPMTMGC
ncbi:reverse transcriptase domain-containing protein [Tanacetum coccineum]